MCYTKHRFTCGHSEKREDRECNHKRSSGFFAKATRCEKTRSERQRSSICKKCESQKREGDGEEKRRRRHESFRELDDREYRQPTQPIQPLQPLQPREVNEAEMFARSERELERKARKEGKSEKQIKQDAAVRQYTRERNEKRKEGKQAKAQNFRSLDDREQKQSNPERGHPARHYREEAYYPPAAESSRQPPRVAPYMAYSSSSSSSQQGYASSSKRHSYQTPQSSYASFPEPEKVTFVPGPGNRASYHPGWAQHQSYHATIEHDEPAHIWTAQKPTDQARWSQAAYSYPANNVVDQYLQENAAIRPPPASSVSSSDDDEYVPRRPERPRGSFDSTRGFQYQPDTATKAKARRAERASYVPPPNSFQSFAAVPQMYDEPQKVHHLSEAHMAQLKGKSRRGSVSGSSKHHHSSSSGNKDRSRPPVSARLHKEKPSSRSRRSSMSDGVNCFLGTKASDESFMCHTAREMESSRR